MTGGVVLALWIFWVIALLVLYHKVFVVYYFDLGQGILKELVMSCILGLIMAIVTVAFWYIAAVIIVLFGLGMMKKADSKVPLVIAVIVAIIICVVGIKLKADSTARNEQAANYNESGYDEYDYKPDISYSEYNDKSMSENYISSSTVENILLSNVYTNEEEGIFFMYPEDWTEREVDGAVFCISAPANSIGFSKTILAVKFEEVDSYSSEEFFSASDSDLEEWYSYSVENVQIVEVSDITLSGYSARNIIYSWSDSRGNYTNVDYYYTMNDSIYAIDCTTFTDSFVEDKSVFDAIINSYTITTYSGDIRNFDAVGEAYAEKVCELSGENSSLQFALIDLTENDELELVVDLPGYYVSVFTWADGEVVCIMDQWAYGAGGNQGYEYLPGQNVIRNFNMDQAGAIVYESYMTVDSTYEVVGLPIEQLSKWYFRDSNGNGMRDEGEPFSEEPICYYGNDEVSADVYASYQISGNYEWISGDQSVDAVLSTLQWNNDANYADGVGDIADPTMFYGYYNNSEGNLTLFMNLFSSPEGNNLGNMQIYDANGMQEYYSGEIYYIDGSYIVKTAEEDLILIFYIDNGDYKIDVYHRGEEFGLLDEFILTVRPMGG